MPGVQVGAYPANREAGSQVSSTYEGRYLTLDEDECVHLAAGLTKGTPVVCGEIVGVAMNTPAATGAYPFSLDTEGIWNLEVIGSDDDGNSAVAAGDELYINITTCVITKIRDVATQKPFGQALGTMNGGVTAVIAVKVHQDLNHPEEVEGDVVFKDAVTINGTVQFMGVAITYGVHYFGAGINITGLAVLNSGLSVAGQVDLQTVFIHSQMYMAGILHFPDNVDAALLPAANPGGVNRLWVNAGVVTRN